MTIIFLSIISILKNLKRSRREFIIFRLR